MPFNKPAFSLVPRTHWAFLTQVSRLLCVSLALGVGGWTALASNLPIRFLSVGSTGFTVYLTLPTKFFFFHNFRTSGHGVSFSAEKPFKVSCGASLAAMGSFTFAGPQQLFILPWNVMTALLGGASLTGGHLPSIAVGAPGRTLPACAASTEKPAAVLQSSFVQNWSSFPRCVFYSFPLLFAVSVTACTDVGFFGLILFGVFCAAWTRVLSQARGASAVMSSHTVSAPFSLSLLLGLS